MSETPTGRPADADLVAFLDGELSPAQAQWVEVWLAHDSALRQRLDVFAQVGTVSIKEAFGALLAEAPEAQLRQMLLALPSYRPDRTITSDRSIWRLVSSRPRLALLAAGIAIFIAGMMTDRLQSDLREIAGIEVASDSEDEWRQAVAEYMSLYTPDTLSGISDEIPPKDRELAAVGAKLGVHLLPSSVSLPGITLKRVQILQYDGKPLGQIAYLDPHDGVVALCIYSDSHHEIGPSSEQRAGLNIVHWASQGRAYMLVGRKAMPELRELAGLLSQRLTL
ncbi:MAG: anti-sigma factor [Bradyrhizobium sp.]|uniref:anti-sigma factor family protein n=1 Tax=Bradyrhizobium sp. TaxID=376 RepID=UPI001D68C99B|nr:anti-sigma factor [Bradyrhizobium sp.]MBV9560261.1 anti-sigma factor [Bradyrhizobium sp.]